MNTNNKGVIRWWIRDMFWWWCVWWSQHHLQISTCTIQREAIIETGKVYFLLARSTSPHAIRHHRERNENRNNANRLFDSQNNDKGGYPWRGDRELKNSADPMIYYEGSKLRVEWTNQHACGKFSLISSFRALLFIRKIINRRWSYYFLYDGSPICLRGYVDRSERRIPFRRSLWRRREQRELFSQIHESIIST